MHHHHHETSRPSPLEIAELADFDAALDDALPEEEKRRRRIVYLREAVAQMEVGRAMLKGFGCFLIPFLLVPIFWPFVAFFWYMRKKSGALMDAQLTGALNYWGIPEYEVRGGGSPPPLRPPPIEAESIEVQDPGPPEKRYRREP